MELLRSFGAEPLIIHSTDTLKNHPLLFPRGETKLRSELERALEIAVHHYINNKDCLGHHKICDNHHRDHLHITVKLYLSHSAGPQCAEQAVQAILHQLETDYIDLLIVSVACLDNLLASWRSLEQLYLESKIKQIGVSEFSVKELHILLQYANVKPALNEAKICCMHDEKEKEDLVKFASINGITIRSQPCHDNDSGTSLESLSPGEIINRKLNTDQNTERWCVNWALRYVVVHSERSIIITEGYLYNIVPKSTITPRSG